MALNLSRNTKVFVSTVNGVTAAGGNITGLSASPGGTNNGFAVGDVLLGGTSDGNGTGASFIVTAISGGGATGPATKLAIPNNMRGTGHSTGDVITCTKKNGATLSSGPQFTVTATSLAAAGGGVTTDGSRTGTGLFKGNEKDANTFRIGVLDGYSFSQASESTDVVINEAGATPKRGSERFNDSLAPAEWSFQTYVRPFKHGAASFRSNTQHDMVENILWAALAGQALNNRKLHSENSGATTNSAVTLENGNTKIDFDSSNAHELLKLNIFFALENTTFRLNDCQVNQVEVDFSIDGIATLSWSGNANSIDQIAAAAHIEDPSKSTEVTISGFTEAANTSALYSEKYNYVDVTGPSDADYLRNKLSTMTLTHKKNASGVLEVDATSSTETYAINITGGSLTIANNITYLTPETLGIVDKPIGSFSGARNISGSLTCYLDTGSNQLLKDMNAATDLVSNEFDMDLYLGGASNATPLVHFDLAKAHLQIPTIETADIISTTIEFAGQGDTISSTDELVVNYKGLTTHSESGYDDEDSLAV